MTDPPATPPLAEPDPHTAYKHQVCGYVTTLDMPNGWIIEGMAHCSYCMATFPVREFLWTNGDPVMTNG